MCPPNIKWQWLCCFISFLYYCQQFLFMLVNMSSVLMVPLLLSTVLVYERHVKLCCCMFCSVLLCSVKTKFYKSRLLTNYVFFIYYFIHLLLKKTTTSWWLLFMLCYKRVSFNLSFLVHVVLDNRLNEKNFIYTNIDENMFLASVTEKTT